MKSYKMAFLASLLSASSITRAADCTCLTSALMNDKSAYHLFHPTPDRLLREFDSDRPDKTQSPHTLDAGRFQVELGLLGYTYDRHNIEHLPVTSRTWTTGDSATLRMGLLEWAELQLTTTFYQSVRETDRVSRESTRTQGIGDLFITLKTNIWGNDSGDTAGGAAFFVKTPTASHGLGNGKVEGGVIFLFASELPGSIDFSLNSGVGISTSDGGGYHADIVNIITLGHEIAGAWSGYLEFFSSVPTDQSREWKGTVDIGLVCQLSKNCQLDLGMNIGVTRAADDLQPFLGVSYRF